MEWKEKLQTEKAGDPSEGTAAAEGSKELGQEPMGGKFAWKRPFLF